ncbi:helix-turn-helix domain-containing protein [Methanococcus voltae]|jgi:transcriptional regulator with XRE-family HTH domain|uniref:Transcriptional regulator with XRE-family HTH domain n=2 Tax=Methanococcus voltae TaxID=2188 RepID=A0A8J7RPU1_METVO|nr:cupin domain-containing protein [Methanococcus voltae]MBP2173154.1 transcriptional regulator with XRE-family HTH domain [Methanococcus voltae]MBP2202054.1 transcriptional regulator with XRE-family HTH domain [Methanococcus voltae]MCS3922857.1 transcriptional regulator with XRE-family HTH domain [Methanococcus voltae PS]
MSEKNNQVGIKIKKVRELNNMSIEELAKISGNDVELLKKIENGDLIPSLKPLIAIARALGVRLGTFLDDLPELGPVVSRFGASENVVRFSGTKTYSNDEESKLNFYSLAAGKIDRHMEPFIIDVYPQANEEIELSSHEGEEFIYVMSGEIEINYGQDVYVLAKGDSIYYDSIVPHNLHAKDQNSKILAVVYTPL